MNERSKTNKINAWRFYFSAIIIPLICLFSVSFAFAASWDQNDWSGGVSADTAIDPDNATGWTKYTSKSDEIDATASGISLNSINGSRTFTTYNDFVGGTFTDTGDMGSWAAEDASLGSVHFIHTTNLVSENTTYTVSRAPQAGYEDNPKGQLTNGLTREQLYGAGDASVMWPAGDTYVDFDLGKIYLGIDEVHIFFGKGHVTAASWSTEQLYMYVPDSVTIYTKNYESDPWQRHTTDASVEESEHEEVISLPSYEARYLRVYMGNGGGSYMGCGEITVRTSNYEGASSGNYVSEVIDLDKEVTSWEDFSWTSTGSVEAKVRFADAGLTWTDWFSINSGQNMQTDILAPRLITGKNRYMQYQFDLIYDGETHPYVDDVTINYTYCPKNGAASITDDTLFKAAFDDLNYFKADYSASGSIEPEAYDSEQLTFSDGGHNNEGIHISDNVNMMTNSGFDQGLSYWNLTQPGSSTVTLETTERLGDSGYSAKITKVGADTSGVYQTHSLAINAWYTLSYYAKGAVDGDKMRLYIRNYDAGDVTWYDYDITGESWGSQGVASDNQITLTDQWARYSYTFKSRAVDLNSRVDLYLYSETSDTFFYLDNVQLETGQSVSSWVNKPQMISTTHEGLVAFYNLENGWNDTASNTHNGVTTNMTTVGAGVTFTQDQSKFGDYSAYFDGTATAYANTAVTPYSGDETTEMTAEAWIKVEDFAEVGRVMHNDYSAAAGKWVMYVNTNGNFYMEVHDGSTAASSLMPITAGVWHHVVGTYDGTTVNLYVDGERDTTPGTITTTLDVASLLWLGENSLTTAFKGWIDNAALYNYVMSADEVKARYGKGILKYSATSNIPTGSGTAGAIEMWVKPDWDGDDATAHYLFDMRETDDTTNAIIIEKTALDNLLFRVSDESISNYREVTYAVDDTTFAADTWHHIVAQWDGASTLQLYLDSNNVGTLTGDGNAFVSALSSNFYVGSDMNGNNQADATIDDIRISQKNFTAEEINALYAGHYFITSSPYDIDTAAPTLQSMGWTDNGEGVIKFQVRSAPDDNGSPNPWTDWMGPDGTSDTYFTTSEEAFPDAMTDGTDDQWIQWETFLQNTGDTPPQITATAFSFLKTGLGLAISGTGATTYTAEAGEIIPVSLKYVDYEGNIVPVWTDPDNPILVYFGGATFSPSGDGPRVSLNADMSQAVDFGSNLGVVFEDGSVQVYIQLVKAQTIDLVATSTSGTTTIVPLATTVEPTTPEQLLWDTEPANSVFAGATWDEFTLYLLDQYENVCTNETSAITILTNENAFDAGTNPVNVSDVTPGYAAFDDLVYNTVNETLTVYASGAGLTSDSKVIDVGFDPDALVYEVTGATDEVAGTPNTITVTCKDPQGNIYEGYTGTVTFESTDPEADLPENYTFEAGDLGTKTFDVTFHTAGTQTITATDTVAATMTGTQENITVTSETLTALDVIPTATTSGGDAIVRETGNLTVEFTVPLTNPIPGDGKIVVVLGATGNTAGDFTFDSGADSEAVINSGLNGSLTATTDGQTITFTRAEGTEKSGAISIKLTNVKNPTSFGETGTYTIQVQNSAGGVMSETADPHVSSDTMIGVLFTSPTTGTSLEVGEQDALIAYSESGTSNNLAFLYIDTSSHTCYNDSNPLSGSYQDGGEDALLWDVPSNAAILTTYVVTAYDLDLSQEVGRSDAFTVSGSVSWTNPSQGDKISYQTPIQLTWSTLGSYGTGVKIHYSLDSTNGINGTWDSVANALTLHSTAEAAIANAQGSSVKNEDDNGVTGTSVYWLPSNDFAGGVSSIWLKIEDANTSAPASSDVVGITISNITSIDYTLPDREATAIKVGQSLNINLSSIGVSNVNIEYKSNTSGQYEAIKDVLGNPATDIAVDSLPFSWVVPDDVSYDPGSYLKVTATETADISGALSKESDVIIMGGAFLRTSPTSGEYKVNDATDRVPIVWSGSESVTDMAFYYTLSLITPSWQNCIGASAGEIYDQATGGTAGQYNWVNGTGTAWWQPRVTSGNVYVRVADANDTESYSATTAGDWFKVSGVSVMGVTATSSVDDVDYLSEISTGTTRYIKGTGSTQNNLINIYYCTDADCLTPVYIAQETLVDGRFSHEWTVADEISDSIYFKVTDPTAEGTVYNSTLTPIKIKGDLTVTAPVAAWVIGETDNTVTGTIAGDVDTIDLQYTTAASPEEADWVDLATDIYVGNYFGSTPTAFTVPAGTFTVPDAISLESFKLRAKDSTDSREADLLGVSAASSGFQVKGAITVTGPTSDEDWYVGGQGTIAYEIAGSSAGDVKVYYGYRKGATPSDDPNDYTWEDTAVVDTSSAGYLGTGIAAVERTYSWTKVADVIETLIGDGADEQDSAVYTAAGNECWIMVKVASATSDVEAYSEGFRAKYYKITWRIKNMTGGYLSGLNATEPAGVLKPAWLVTDNSIPTSPGDFDRYYPASGATSYNTTFIKTTGNTEYTGTKEWQCNSDKVIAVSIDTSESVLWDVAIDTTYDYNTTTLRVSSWMERQGLQLNDTLLDSLESAEIFIYDSTGTQINTTPITDDAADSNGVYYFTWNTSNDGVSLVRGEQYLVKATIQFASAGYSSSTTFTLEAATTYDVKVSTAYDSSNDAIMITTSLLESGNLVTDISKTALTDCRVYNRQGTDLSGDLSGPSTTITDNTNAVFHSDFDPADGLETYTVYTVVSKITYASTEYSGTENFTLESYDAISQEISAVSTKMDTVVASVDSSTDVIEDVGTAVDALATDQAAFRTATASSLSTIETTTGSISTNVGAIMEDDTTTTLQEVIENELAKGVQSGILNRPTTAEPGALVKIRYKNESSLTPTIKVYDPSNTLILPAKSMNEIVSGSGIYEYPLTIPENWETGDYTIVCSESTTGAVDSMVLNVSESNLSAIATNINGIQTDVSVLSTLASLIGSYSDATTAQTIFGKLSAIGADADDTEETLVDKVDNVNDYLAQVDDLLGGPSDSVNASTIFGQIAAVESSIGVIDQSSDPNQPSTIAEYVDDAREYAEQAAQRSRDIRESLSVNDSESINKALKLVPDLKQALTKAQESLNLIPKMADAGFFEGDVKKALKSLGKLASTGGFKKLIKNADAFNPEDMTDVRNTVTELKAMMDQVRDLLDKEVNQPVVQGWMEEGR